MHSRNNLVLTEMSFCVHLLGQENTDACLGEEALGIQEGVSLTSLTTGWQRPDLLDTASGIPQEARPLEG